eukprot:3943752-Prorocentrum_lima.AAC.1
MAMSLASRLKGIQERPHTCMHGGLAPSPAWLPGMAALRKRLFHLVAARVGVLMEKVLAGARTSPSS